MGEKFRLDRFLGECGQGTRSEIKGYIKKGRVTVNGVVAKDNGMKVDTDTDIVCFNGEEIVYEKFRYFMLNKPQGVVSATRDGISKTVLELLSGEITEGLFPVGRLDKDTEGFLLITNDGQLGHELLSPKKHVGKKYLATVDAPLTEEEMRTFAEGVDIGDEKKTMPAEIRTVLEDWDDTVYEVILREGRYHQVKRMFEAFGSTVTYLKRVSMGDVELDPELQPGE
ncbi:MAG: rRNA pseudouridine synthase [Clostridiales bacterium]|nr:rRNA pseudouridine synthase [Candidatus Crickella merdequi]